VQFFSIKIYKNIFIFFIVYIKTVLFTFLSMNKEKNSVFMFFVPKCDAAQPTYKPLAASQLLQDLRSAGGYRGLKGVKGGIGPENTVARCC